MTNIKKQHLVADATWFSRPETRALFAALNAGGYEARAVGGAVRNTLLGEPVDDVDFATTALPEDTMRLAANAGFKTAPTGLTHGTVTVIVGGQPFEVTTLRRDVETDGRHAQVAFTADWTADAARRDFTINALYADESGAIHDPLGMGVADAEAGRVRFIGDPIARMREDYLRILRFFRFGARYERGPFDGAALAACTSERDGLSRIAIERIRSELLKLLVAKRAADAIAAMAEGCILEAVLPIRFDAAALRHMVALETAHHIAPNPLRRLLAATDADDQKAVKLAATLKLSSAEAAMMEETARLASKPAVLTETNALRPLLYRLGAEVTLCGLLIAWVKSGAAPDDGRWCAGLQEVKDWTPKVFPLSGRDLLPAGLEPGPAVGAALKAAEEAWIASDFTLTKDNLRELALSNVQRKNR
jgi:tRNA nucleotidyltransferase/poly(A) polymerase